MIILSILRFHLKPEVIKIKKSKYSRQVRYQPWSIHRYAFLADKRCLVKVSRTAWLGILSLEILKRGETPCGFTRLFTEWLQQNMKWRNTGSGMILTIGVTFFVCFDVRLDAQGILLSGVICCSSMDGLWDSNQKRQAENSTMSKMLILITTVTFNWQISYDEYSFPNPFYLFLGENETAFTRHFTALHICQLLIMSGM